MNKYDIIIMSLGTLPSFLEMLADGASRLTFNFP